MLNPLPLLKSSFKFFTMGLPEILIIAVVILVLFGAKKIPELMKGVGKGISEFNKEKNTTDDLKDDELKQ